MSLKTFLVNYTRLEAEPFMWVNQTDTYLVRARNSLDAIHYISRTYDIYEGALEAEEISSSEVPYSNAKL